MGEEHSHRRKRVSDGGLQPTKGDIEPVRILPSGNGGNGSTTPHADAEEEWVVELGGSDSLDDPTMRLPAFPEAAQARGDGGSIHTDATVPYPVVAPPAPVTPATQASTPPPQAPAFPPYATYDPAPLQAPALPAGRSLVERDERGRDEKQPVTVVRQGPTPCSILAITFGVIAISCALLTFGVVKDGFAGLGNLFGWIPNPWAPPVVAIDTSGPNVIKMAIPVRRLETYHYSIEKVVSGQSSAFLASDKILLVAHGDVIAGVDLKKLTDKDIRVVTETNSVVIKLPKAEIFNPDNIINESKTYVYDRSRPNPLYTDANLEKLVREAAAKEILDAAIEDGILSKAQTNAEDVIRGIVTGLGYKDEDIKFETGP